MTLTAEDVVNKDISTLKNTNEEIDVSASDLVDAFPDFEHHMTVKAKLRELARRGVIKKTEIDQIHADWASE